MSTGQRSVEIDLCAALRELEHVRRMERARLLREASALRATSESADARRLGSWRTSALEELASGAADDPRADGLLSELLALPPALWPGPVEIARAALALEDCDAGRLGLARAEASEGRPRAAIEELTQLLSECPSSGTRSTAMEELALALLGEGDERAALAWIEAASGEMRSSLESAVGALALALVCGDARRAHAAAARLERLDPSIPGSSRRLRSAISRWTARVHRRGQPILARGPERALAEELASRVNGNRAAPALVARALLE